MRSWTYIPRASHQFQGRAPECELPSAFFVCVVVVDRLYPAQPSESSQRVRNDVDEEKKNRTETKNLITFSFPVTPNPAS